MDVRGDEALSRRGKAFLPRWRAAVLTRDNGLTSTQKLALIALSQWADGTGGSCFPSSVSVAESSSLSDKAVRSALEAADSLGWIGRKKRPIGKGKNWRGFLYEYQLQMPDGAKRHSGANDVAEERSSGASAQHGEERHSSPKHFAAECGTDGAERHSIGAERRTDDLDLDLDQDLVREQETASPAEQIFKTGLQYLLKNGAKEQAARSFLGRLCKNVGSEREVVNLLKQAEAKGVIDPIAWLAAAGKGKRRTAAESFGDKKYVGTAESEIERII